MPSADVNRRYEKHRDEIACRFFNGEDPGDIMKITGTGDAHLHGETVSRIETMSGKAVYYKPRDCRCTLLLGELCGLLFHTRMVPEQISGDGYAFQKAAVHTAPETPEKQRMYYEALGKLTAVFYALGSTDMHRSNILCENCLPVVIDTETVLCARAVGFGGSGEFSVDYGEIFPEYLTSVGESAVLPRFYALQQHSPLLPGGMCDPKPSEGFFLSGFEEGYEKIRNNREDIFSLLDRYADAPFRYLLRSTKSYAVTQVKYAAANNCAAKEQALKGLEKGLSEADLKRWKSVLSWERACIREGDIPYFWLIAGKKGLWGGRTEEPLIRDHLTASPIDHAKWRINRMDSHDLAVQTAYIRAGMRHIDGWTDRKGAENAAAGSPNEPLTCEEAVREVCGAIDQLWQERIPLSGGKMLWHMPFVNGMPGSMFGLSEGFSGIAVFAHACASAAMLPEKSRKTAELIEEACFRDMAAFGSYLLETYPIPPEERILDRRFNGGFSFRTGLSGLLWALDRCREKDPAAAERILNGFMGWNIKDGYPEALAAFLQTPARSPEIREINYPSFQTDTLDGGAVLKAARLLYAADAEKDQDALAAAGMILKSIAERKRESGSYRVYRKSRNQYFLPAFLKGSTGIAYIMLRFAEVSLRMTKINLI